jgi:hypothetical protein
MGSAYVLPGTRINVEPLGDKDGVNDTYTFPDGEAAIPASLIVYLNGQALRPDSVSCSTPYTTFVLTSDVLPLLADSLTCSYTLKI